MPTRTAFSALLTLFTLILFTGCGGGDSGPSRYGVKGTVTLDGAPLAMGNIQFQPQTADINNAPTAIGYIKDGSFVIHPTVGPIAGPQQVVIRLVEMGEVPEKAPDDDSDEEPEAETIVKGVIRTNAEIKADGENELTLELTSDQIQPEEQDEE